MNTTETCTPALQQFEVVCDGSCLRELQVGGWAAHVRPLKQTKKVAPKVLTGAGTTRCSTEAEIQAMLLGLRSVPAGSRVRLLTDQVDLVGMLRDGRPMRGRLAPLLEQVREECKRREVVPVWVRGHRGHPAHTKCDLAARGAAFRAARIAAAIH